MSSTGRLRIPLSGAGATGLQRAVAALALPTEGWPSLGCEKE